MGYRYISIFQIGLTAILIISLPLWKQFQNKGNTGQPDSSSVCTLPALTLKQIFQIPGAREILFAFFCTLQSNRHPLSGPVVISFCTWVILQRKQLDSQVSSLLELL